MILLDRLSEMTEIMTCNAHIFGNILKFVSHPCKEALMFERTNYGEKLYLQKSDLLVSLYTVRGQVSQFL